MNVPQEAPASSGIEELIEKLRQQGVDRGRVEAEQLLRDAEAEASLLLEQAQQQAEQIVAEARREAARNRQAGEDALRMAARDLQLEVKESLARSFSDQVERLVQQQMEDKDFVRRMVLELVGQAREQAELDQAEALEVLLPDHIIGLDELRRNASEYRQGQLSQFVQSLSADLLREGVSFGTHNGRGLRVRLVGSEVEVDLSEGAVASLLLRHLQPRFRALLEGVIR